MSFKMKQIPLVRYRRKMQFPGRRETTLSTLDVKIAGCCPKSNYKSCNQLFGQPTMAFWPQEVNYAPSALVRGCFQCPAFLSMESRAPEAAGPRGSCCSPKPEAGAGVAHTKGAIAARGWALPGEAGRLGCTHCWAGPSAPSPPSWH